MGRAVLTCCFVATIMVHQAGCNTKEKAGVEGGTPKNTTVAKADSPIPAVGQPSPSSGGSQSKATNQGVGGGKENGEATGGTPATELSRLENKRFVVFYKGFTEEQMTAYTDHLYKYYTVGKEPKRDYGLFHYQPKLAQEGKGMHVVREDDFTRIMFPVERRFKDDKILFGNLAIPLCHSLIKIDPSVKGKVTYATCNEDCTVIYRAADKFNKR